jgi:peptide/nickel transport system substrate-binding protein
MTTAGNRTRELVQQVLQSQWRGLGIEVSIRNEPPRVFFGETLNKRRFPDMALFAWISSPENLPHSSLHSTSVPAEANGWSGQNYTGYANPRMDELIDAAEVELDREKRRASGARSSASTPPSCPRSRSTTAPTPTSGRSGWRGSSRPGTWRR